MSEKTGKGKDMMRHIEDEIVMSSGIWKCESINFLVALAGI
jgi:hypothetical protein